MYTEPINWKTSLVLGVWSGSGADECPLKTQEGKFLLCVERTGVEGRDISELSYGDAKAWLETKDFPGFVVDAVN
jgi:hypothetical protein